MNPSIDKRTEAASASQAVKQTVRRWPSKPKGTTERPQAVQQRGCKEATASPRQNRNQEPSATGTKTRNQNLNRNCPDSNNAYPHPRPTTDPHPTRKTTPTSTTTRTPYQQDGAADGRLGVLLRIVLFCFLLSNGLL
ncbi:hypothetical protein GOODEAATRI_022107 [Goodea atripinnis]|uniref:Uncharacterized protein n=1 Tax=Goodea atripinnis TaxID=208336 RepID=A0ABV0NCM7_9TELE